MKNRRIKPPKHDPHSEYHRLWRVVDGAVRDTFKQHPDYLTPMGHKSAQESIIKRVTGAVLASFAARREAEPDTSGG